MNDQTPFRSPAPVGAGALPAYLLSAVLTVGLVAALERTDWSAVARRAHRRYARMYDTITNVHRRVRCAAAVCASSACVGAAVGLLLQRATAAHVALAALLVALALGSLALPGNDHPWYGDHEPRRIALIPPGRPGHGWIFAAETRITWADEHQVPDSTPGLRVPADIRSFGRRHEG